MTNFFIIRHKCVQYKICIYLYARVKGYLKIFMLQKRLFFFFFKWTPVLFSENDLLKDIQIISSIILYHGTVVGSIVAKKKKKTKYKRRKKQKSKKRVGQVGEENKDSEKKRIFKRKNKILLLRR